MPAFRTPPWAQSSAKMYTKPLPETQLFFCVAFCLVSAVFAGRTEFAHLDFEKVGRFPRSYFLSVFF
jgi:hypothetical protein